METDQQNDTNPRNTKKKDLNTLQNIEITRSGRAICYCVLRDSYKHLLGRLAQKSTQCTAPDAMIFSMKNIPFLFELFEHMLLIDTHRTTVMYPNNWWLVVMGHHRTKFMFSCVRSKKCCLQMLFQAFSCEFGESATEKCPGKENWNQNEIRPVSTQAAQCFANLRVLNFSYLYSNVGGHR